MNIVRIDAATREEIRSSAEFVESVISKALGKNVGYGIDGVKWLDAFIQRQHVGGDKNIYDQIVSAYGSYLGECIVQNVGGEWTQIDGSEAIAFDMNNAVFPFSKLRKHLNNGNEAGDSVLGFYGSVKELFNKFTN